MDFSYLFEPYDTLISQADMAFNRMKTDFPACVRCEPHCSDCCHAVFGLFLVEAAFLKHDFDQLDDSEKEAALRRSLEADREASALERTLQEFGDDPEMRSYTMARARIRCPLLNDQDECIVYAYRPVTCRVYGIPTMVQGTPRVCGKSGFKNGVEYPIFNLDGVQRELYRLSSELVRRSGSEDSDKASLLFSVSKVIRTPIETLINERPEAPSTAR
jgi:Fe-S-cluster containining protein